MVYVFKVVLTVVVDFSILPLHIYLTLIRVV